MVENIEQCKKALATIASYQQVINMANAKKADDVVTSQKEFNDKTFKLKAKIEELEKELCAYVTANRAELIPDGVKFVNLQFGEVGFRKTADTIEPLPGSSWESAVAAIKKKFAKNADMLIQLVKFKEEPQKTGLKKLDTKQLNAVGLQMSVGEDKFYYEVFPLTS